jgi:hypothetical protein
VDSDLTDLRDEDNSDHACIDAEYADDFVMEQILDRLEVEPDLIPRSVQALRRTAGLRVEIAAELSTLEAEPDIVAEAMSIDRETVGTMSYEAVRLVLFYLVDKIVVGSPKLPLDEQITITWRVPEVTAT